MYPDTLILTMNFPSISLMSDAHAESVPVPTWLKALPRMILRITLRPAKPLQVLYSVVH